MMNIDFSKELYIFDQGGVIFTKPPKRTFSQCLSNYLKADAAKVHYVFNQAKMIFNKDYNLDGSVEYLSNYYDIPLEILKDVLSESELGMDNTIVDLLHTLETKERKLGYFTNGSSFGLEILSTFLEILPTFELKFASDTELLWKPDILAFQKIREKISEMGLNMEDSVFIDDQEKHLEIFKSLGGTVESID